MRVYNAVVRLPLKIGGKAEGTQPIRDLDTVRGFLSGIGPVALFDLPWMPVYLIICFVFHTYIGLDALFGAIILMTITVLTELTTRRPTRTHDAVRGGAQRLAGEQAGATPRRSPRWAWSAVLRALERSQSQVYGRQPARQRHRRWPRRHVQGAAHDAAIGDPRRRRLAGDQSTVDRRHHHRRLDPRRAAHWRPSILLSPIGAVSSPRGKAGSGCRVCWHTCHPSWRRCRYSRRSARWSCRGGP